MEILPVSTSNSTTVDDLFSRRQKAQVHVKFSNSDNHELLHHQRYSKSKKEVFSREIVSLRSILWEIDKINEDEEVASFRDKYEHVVQKHKMNKKVKSR
ncbi:hypothetical protein Tco_1118235 [Tanacetum coccineum]